MGFGSNIRLVKSSGDGGWEKYPTYTSLLMTGCLSLYFGAVKLGLSLSYTCCYTCLLWHWACWAKFPENIQLFLTHQTLILVGSYICCLWHWAYWVIVPSRASNFCSGMNFRVQFGTYNLAICTTNWSWVLWMLKVCARHKALDAKCNETEDCWIINLDVL